MGMKDQFQDQATEYQQKGKEKLGQTRERAGQHGQQPQRGQQPQSERGRQNMRDIDDTEQEMQERFDQDYDA